MTLDESPLHISTVYKLGVLDTQERGLTTQGVSELLQRAAKTIAGLGAVSIEDLVLDEGSYYGVSWIDVYYTNQGGTSAISHFNVRSGPGKHQQIVPELLRRTADAIAGLGEVQVEGLVLHENDDMDGIGRGPWISVYYREKNA
jgi:exosome complex RNA-binding protein Rrp42 (RNase PH superfamily)